MLRTSVAPDHQEMKNPIKSFDSLFEEHANSLSFYGNIPHTLLSSNLDYFSSAYSATLLCHGSNGMAIPSFPGSCNIIPATELIRFYNNDFSETYANGIDRYKLMGSDIAIIGAGNVSIDMIRMLTKNSDLLESTDINPEFLAARKIAGIRSISVFSRSGIFNQKMSTAVLREISKINGIKIKFQNTLSTDDCNSRFSSIPQNKSRLIKLIQDINMRQNLSSGLIPVSFILNSKMLGISKNLDNSYSLSCAIDSKDKTFKFDQVFASTGFRVLPIVSQCKFDEKKMHYIHENGKIHLLNHGEVDSIDMNGVFCSGWSYSGPRGTIAESMINSFQVSNEICSLIQSGAYSKKGQECDEIQNFLRLKGIEFTTFKDWKKIDEYEKESGKKAAKIRLKIDDKQTLFNLIR